jgi:iron-sulfur cluster repair protein YtfE (RIC family)
MLHYSITPVPHGLFPMRHPSLIALSHDHHHGLALALRCRKQALGQLKPMGAAGLRERAKEVLDFFTANLIAHFSAEEKVLFPALRVAAPQSFALIDDLCRDHEQIRAAMPALETGTGLAKIIFDLGDLLERHIRREERELFPLFERHFETDKADVIGAEMKKIFDTKAEGGDEGGRMKDEG